jgi:uncharacterized membrane protein
MKIGDIVKSHKDIAIITGISPSKTRGENILVLDLLFITEKPSIYYVMSDGWEVIGESAPLVMELL